MISSRSSRRSTWRARRSIRDSRARARRNDARAARSTSCAINSSERRARVRRAGAQVDPAAVVRAATRARDVRRLVRRQGSPRSHDRVVCGRARAPHSRSIRCSCARARRSPRASARRSTSVPSTCSTPHLTRQLCAVDRSSRSTRAVTSAIARSGSRSRTALRVWHGPPAASTGGAGRSSRGRWKDRFSAN